MTSHLTHFAGINPGDPIFSKAGDGMKNAALPIGLRRLKWDELMHRGDMVAGRLWPEAAAPVKGLSQK